LQRERLRTSGPRAIVMHPGPMIRGLEITSDVADGSQSVITEQVRNGVSIRMALIHRALAPALKTSRPEKKPISRPSARRKRGGA
jgi:aspartate carbamoyltransferase catalytic subunit